MKFSDEKMQELFDKMKIAFVLYDETNVDDEKEYADIAQYEFLESVHDLIAYVENKIKEK